MKLPAVVYMQKEQFPNCSCLTFAIGDEITAPLEKSGEDFEIRIPPEELDKMRGGSLPENAPLIGIILAREGDNYSIDEPYVQSVAQTGADIRFIHYSNVEKQLENVDAALLIGGSFPSPKEWYGKDYPGLAPMAEMPPRSRAYITIINYAEKHKMPMFGVCGGMQMMAGMHGAKLAKAADFFPESKLFHRGINANDYAHDIEIVPGSRLSAFADGKAQINVNSAHSEIVATVPEDKLIITARASDGIIEAFEYTDYDGYALAVQWHPERMAVQGEKLSRKLYQQLTDEAAKYRLKRRD